MVFQFQPSLPLFVVILLCTASLAIYSFWQYHHRGRRSDVLAFIALLLVICVWQLNAIFISIITIKQLLLAGNNFGNAVLVPSLAYSFLWFAATYSQNTQWINRWTVAFALLTIGVAGVVILVNPEFFYKVNGLDTYGPTTIFGVTFGEWVGLDRTVKPAFRLFQLYSYFIIITAAGILTRYVFHNRDSLYRGQVAALLIGVGTPPSISTLLFTGILPPALNLTHISFAITAVAFAVAMFRYQLFSIAPMGRRQLVEQLSDAVVILDEENHVVDCNPVARELVDAPNRWRGMDAAAFFAPFSDPVNCFTTTRSGETTLPEAGTERSFMIDSNSIRNRRGTQTGQLVQLREITEQKTRERQLEKQNEDLDEFASMISHDLQSPLNVAKGRLKLAERESDSEHLAEVDEALTRMESLIDTLLTKARYSQTADDFEPIPLERAAKTAWTYSDIDDCTFHTLVPTEVEIIADRDRLLELFQNLYENAGDHNETPVNVRVGVIGEETAPSSDGEQTGFYVADDGSGISPGDRENLFEKGYTTSSSGTGLGLAIVQDIVTAHDWEITVTESEDDGARFEITSVEFTTS